MIKTSFFIKTLGCKVNQYESQVIREGFLKNGFIEAEDEDDADIYIVNSCTVTRESDSKSLRLIRRAAKKNNKCVIATGCMVEDSDLDLSRLDKAQFIVRNKDKYKIPDIVAHSRITNDERQITKITRLKAHTRVFVKVQDGCDNSCSYCKVRIVRGHSRSRPFREVVDECASLINNGAKEIVLTGICLGSYGRDLRNGIDISGLIKALSKIKGDWRLRLSSIEPKDINGELIEQLRFEDRLCKHLHIPFQSGDDYILKRMARSYTRSDYFKIVDRLKKAVPDIAISTDIMVGFPGETDERFEESFNFIRQVQPMRIHVFPFSKRKGTKAGGYKDDISDGVKKEREKRLFLLAEELTDTFVLRFIGKEVRVLVEDKRTEDGHLQGYSDRYIKVYIIKAPEGLKGRFIDCLATLTNHKVCGILQLH